jgi:hypothetical protein
MCLVNRERFERDNVFCEKMQKSETIILFILLIILPSSLILGLVDRQWSQTYDVKIWRVGVNREEPPFHSINCPTISCAYQRIRKSLG